jgi:multisubunit Na+/H+ antiporter MnhG subunit
VTAPVSGLAIGQAAHRSGAAPAPGTLRDDPDG